MLQDVVKTMFHERFIEEVFKPQAVYTPVALRGIFEKLAHSSIMRLSESSMDKLYDLMCMGMKQQVVCSSYAGELYAVTMNHLETMFPMIAGTLAEGRLISVRNKFVSVYQPMSPWQWMLIRKEILGFMQDRRVKVSLFLAEGLQANDGTPIISLKGRLPPQTKPPGVIYIRDSAGGAIVASVSFSMSSEISADVTPPPTTLYTSAEYSPWGGNIYERSHSSSHGGKTAAGAHPPPGATTATAASTSTVMPPPVSHDFKNESVPSVTDAPGDRDDPPSGRGKEPTGGLVQRAELNMLVSMLSSGAAGNENDNDGGDSFKLNLFPESDANVFSSSSATSGQKNSSSTPSHPDDSLWQIQTVDVRMDSSIITKLQEEMSATSLPLNEASGAGTEAEETDDADLLDLMDMAAM